MNEIELQTIAGQEYPTNQSQNICSMKARLHQLCLLRRGYDLFSYRLDKRTMVRFTMTVRKNYRPIPYHNWDHGFSVAHSMYYLLTAGNHSFSNLEVSVQRCQCRTIKLTLLVKCDYNHLGLSWSSLNSCVPLGDILCIFTMKCKPGELPKTL